jgi:hypothetical protein
VNYGQRNIIVKNKIKMTKREILEERIKEYKSIISWVREDGDEYEEIPMYEQMIKETQEELNNLNKDE